MAKADLTRMTEVQKVARSLVRRAIGHLRRAEGHARKGEWQEMNVAIKDANESSIEAVELGEEEDGRMLVGTRSWLNLKALGVTRLRCGRHSRISWFGCSLPQGHRGSHDFSVEDSER